MTFGEKEEMMEFLKRMDRGNMEVGCPGCSQCDGPDLVVSKFKDLDGEYLVSEYVLDQLYSFAVDKAWSDANDIIQEKDDKIEELSYQIMDLNERGQE